MLSLYISQPTQGYVTDEPGYVSTDPPGYDTTTEPYTTTADGYDTTTYITTTVEPGPIKGNRIPGYNTRRRIG